MDELRSKILNLLTRPLFPDEIYSALSENTRGEISALLESMEQEGTIIRARKGKYVSLSASGFIRGTYRDSGRGYGFVVPDENFPAGDVFIPPKKNMGAWHLDKVLIRVSPSANGRKGEEGEVTKLVRRSDAEIPGRFIKKGPNAYIIPDSRFYPSKIAIGRGKFLSAKQGDKVFAKMLSYGSGRTEPYAEVRAVMGPDGELLPAVRARLYTYQIKSIFPDEVLSQVKAYPSSPAVSDMEGRLDLRDKIIFTIDGDDAKDFDDAVSLEYAENGNYVLGVHIADVSHYVTPNSPLDFEAFERGTSVYYADKVVPMLPVELSNGLCSLNPNVDRLCFSAIMEIDKTGEVKTYTLKKSVIRSVERMTYRNCNQLLSPDCDPALKKRYEKILPVLTEMAALAQILYQKRMERGALDLDMPESKISCDETGFPIDVKPYDRGVSERLIEDFMLIANETVAQHMFWAEAPAVYRVHEKPDPLKIKFLAKFIAAYGLSLRTDAREVFSSELQKVLIAVRGRPEDRIVSSLLLRSLARAKYLDECLGHFGLATKYYCHFTSPIRRYPDLVTHRMLQKLLTEGFTDNSREASRIFCKNAADRSTERELASDNAERDIEKVYKAAYMTKHIGEEFEGIISSVTNFGLFVELPSTIEGYIPLEALGRNLLYDDERLTLSDAVTGTVYTVGRGVKVLCVSADIDSGEVNFELVL